MNYASSSQPRPKLDEIKKEARRLLHDLKQGDASALRRYKAFQSWDRIPAPNLADARYVIAREHGYSTWRKLLEDLDSTNSANP